MALDHALRRRASLPMPRLPTPKAPLAPPLLLLLLTCALAGVVASSWELPPAWRDAAARPDSLRVASGSLARAPLDASRVVTRLAFGSCNKPEEPQGYWDAVRARAPSAWAWLGDVHYADTPVLLKIRIPASAERLAAQWSAQLAAPAYRRFAEAVPVVGVYDDHDYGQNDGDRTYNATARALSQQLLLDFLGEPPSAPRRAQEGVYTHYLLGPPARQLLLVLLDVRTNRDPYGSRGGSMDMLGEEQWAWLDALLAETPAEITVIGSGIQVLSHGDPWVSEMWYKLPGSQARLLALLAKYRRQGVLFISGDIHFAGAPRADGRSGG